MVLLTADKKLLQSGTMLAEVILAGAVISIALASAVVVVGGLQSMFVDLQNGQNATLLARQSLARAHLVDFSNLVSFKKVDKVSDITFSTNFSVSYKNTFVADVLADVSWSEGASIKHRVIDDEIVDWQNTAGLPSCGALVDNSGQFTEIPSSLSISLGNAITDMAVQGDFAYVSADSATSSLPDFYVIDIKDIKNPKILSSLNTGPGIAALAVSGSYVFVANRASHQMQVIDISNPSSPVLISQAKLPGVTVSGSSGFGQSITYFNKKIYIGLTKTGGPELHIVDVVNPQNPIELGSFEVNSTVNSISVWGDHAVIGTPGAQSVTALDVSNPSAAVVVGQSTLPGWQTQGVSVVSMLGPYIYVGRTLGGFFSPNPEFLFLDRNTFQTPAGALYLAATVDDFFVYGNYIYMATSDNSKAFQVIKRPDLSTTTALVPTLMSAALPSRAVSFACNDQAVYVVTQDNQDFLHVFSPI